MVVEPSSAHSRSWHLSTTPCPLLLNDPSAEMQLIFRSAPSVTGESRGHLADSVWAEGRLAFSAMMLTWTAPDNIPSDEDAFAAIK